MAGKKKNRLKGMRRVMNILGWFHHIQGVFQLLLGCFAVSVGVGPLGARGREALPPAFSFLRRYSDTALGVIIVMMLLVSVITQFVLGRIWRKKARNSLSQTTAMVLSGAKIAAALYLILRGGILTARWANIHSLILNTLSFLLAFWLHREYRRTARQP